MSERHQPGDAGREARIDRAIDGAVREMLAVEPRADMRARVIARLPASGFRLPAAGFRLPSSVFVLSSVAAAALILLAVFVARRSEPLPQAPVVAHAPDHYLPSEAAPAPPMHRDDAPKVRLAARVAPVASPVHEVAPTMTQPARGTVMAADYSGDEVAATAIGPLETIAPITIKPLGNDRIVPAEIGVRPLPRISDVQIAPLTPPDRR
jgi:hypothetical protein